MSFGDVVFGLVGLLVVAGAVWVLLRQRENRRNEIVGGPPSSGGTDWDSDTVNPRGNGPMAE